jgi:succinate dehydrogenase hydrophobic anchor subunit
MKALSLIFIFFAAASPVAMICVLFLMLFCLMASFHLQTRIYEFFGIFAGCMSFWCATLFALFMVILIHSISSIAHISRDLVKNLFPEHDT